MSSAKEKLLLLMDAYRTFIDARPDNDVEKEENEGLNSDSNSTQRHFLEAYRLYRSAVQSQDHSPDETQLLKEAIELCRHHKLTGKISPLTSGKSPVFEPVLPEGDAERNADAETKEEKSSSKEKSSQKEFSLQTADHSKGQVTIVESEGKKYTRIGPPVTDTHRSFAPSPDSAFQPTLALDRKRFRLDPGLQHLQDPLKAGLSRSASMPGSYLDGVESTPHLHRVLYRTSSFVSDLTKQKLKNSILSRTSAALVKKPSITDQEMRELRNSEGSDDSDSSASENEDDDVASSNARKRKYPDDLAPVNNVRGVAQFLPAVITTTGPT